MEIPRGFAMLPLNEADFLDFIYNYFKAEYAPIRSFWSTATAEPRHPQRWISMGHELAPLSFRSANAQAQKDLDSLDFFARKWNLDVAFVRGILVRFAKYEVHERLEKKLYESYRLDLMVRKALKEKHLVDALWPSPAPRNLDKELLAQGVQVRRWYGDMFTKYFRHLHSVDDFSLRSEVDTFIKSTGTLMLVPFVDHLVFGDADPIIPIIAKGAGYSNAKVLKQRDGRSFGEPERFEIRFDAPVEIEDTHTRSVVRQCQCLKCGSKRDVTVVISMDPTPEPSSQRTGSVTRRPTNPNMSVPRRNSSKAASRYSPGYAMPGVGEVPPPQPPRPKSQSQAAPQTGELPSPQQKKQCPRCTFLNHPDLTSCEMCQGELPDSTIVSKPPSPVASTSKPAHSHSASLPPPITADIQKKPKNPERPSALNRHSLSSTLLSMFPFTPQQESEQQAKPPPTEMQPKSQPEMAQTTKERNPNPKVKSSTRDSSHSTKEPSLPQAEPHAPVPRQASTPEPVSNSHDPSSRPELPLNQIPELAMMPLTPPMSSAQQQRVPPAGMPQSLMDDFVPVSPAFHQDDEGEDAGWGEMSREEAKDEDESEGEGELVGRKEGLVDLDAVAREEMGVWGERDD